MSTQNLETRKRILLAALDLLKEKKGKAVRMADIAAKADLSRQAVYLHFKSRTNLMVAAVQFGDQLNNVSEQVNPWKIAEGVEKLDAWVEFWGNYIPQIYGVAKVLILARETDKAAEAAWNDRMKDVRDSCQKTIDSLIAENKLSKIWNQKTATDFLWTHLSIYSWEQYVHTCGWSNEQYINNMKILTKRALLDE